MSAKMTLTGGKFLKKKLNHLAKKSPVIVKKAMGPPAREMAKAIKREIPSSWKWAKRTIGSRVSRPGKGNFKGIIFAKAGAGVGMSKKRRMTANAKAKEKGRGKRKGVGIGVSNIMWFLMGTEKRYTGSKRVGAHRRGVKNRRKLTGGRIRYTGRLKKSGIMQRAQRKTRGKIRRMIATGLIKGIFKEAKR